MDLKFLDAWLEVNGEVNLSVNQRNGSVSDESGRQSELKNQEGNCHDNENAKTQNLVSGEVVPGGFEGSGEEKRIHVLVWICEMILAGGGKNGKRFDWEEIL